MQQKEMLNKNWLGLLDLMEKKYLPKYRTLFLSFSKGHKNVLFKYLFCTKSSTFPFSGPMTQVFLADNVTNQNKSKLYSGGNLKYFLGITKDSQMQSPQHSAWFVPLCRCTLEHLGAQEDQQLLVHPKRSTKMTQALFLHIHIALQKHWKSLYWSNVSQDLTHYNVFLNHYNE